MADEDRDQARHRCTTWKREEAVDGEDCEHVTVLRPRWGARTGVPDRAAVVASLPPPFNAGRKRAPRRREVPQRPVRKRAPGRVAVVHQQCKRASPTRRRRPSKRRRHVRAGARKAVGNVPSRMERRAGERQNCDENVHGRNLAGDGRRSSTGLLLAAMLGHERDGNGTGSARGRELTLVSVYQASDLGLPPAAGGVHGSGTVLNLFRRRTTALPDGHSRNQACRLSAKTRQRRTSAVRTSRERRGSAAAVALRP
jgi:hypothetical protein